jgi:hypothetical protein
VAAQTELSERECRSLETVRPPRENARSASTEVAVFTISTLAQLIKYAVLTWRSEEVQGHATDGLIPASLPVLDGVGAGSPRLH